MSKLKSPALASLAASLGCLGVAATSSLLSGSLSGGALPVAGMLLNGLLGDLSMNIASDQILKVSPKQLRATFLNKSPDTSNHDLQKSDYRAIPTAIFTVPAVASVGITEQELQSTEVDAVVKLHDMRDWLSSKSYAETVSLAKVIVDNSTDLILGAHIAGHKGEELVHMFAMAMQYGITATQLRESVYAFPTFSSDLKSLV